MDALLQSCMTISDDDANLFRAAIGPVRPLKHNFAAARVRRAPPPPRLLPQADLLLSACGDAAPAPSVVPLAADDPSSFRRPGVNLHLFHRLKKGRLGTEDDIDLHGATVLQAQRMLLHFLAHAQMQGYRCVRIIHGKGRQSESSYPPLKNLVDRLLRQERSVLAFHSTARYHGGTGAVCVLLSRRSDE